MRLSLKLLLVLAMSLAILVPLTMIRGTIQERQAYRQQAVADIAASHAGAQLLSGPVLVVPYVATVVTEERDAQGLVRHASVERAGQWTFFPSSLAVNGRLRPDVRRRGLHKVRVYELKGVEHALFDVRIPPDDDPAHPRRIGEPWLDYGIADVRGLAGSPTLVVDGRAHAIEQGAHAGQGIHARLAVPAAGSALRLDTRLDFALDGTESLALAPLGDANHFTLDSSWPHPQFTGSFLPRSRSVGDAGFHATWDISSLATSAQRQYLAGAGRADVQPAETTSAAPGMDVVGISLVDPVNIYTQADRASKYGLLFVLLTFLGFFMFELLRQLPVHPIQYGLVGLALAIFFLLLVSLSEHVEFAVAYVISSVACIGLIGVYLGAVLRSAVRGAWFGAMLALLYAALYGLLVSEDNALVLGACLLFVILAAIMLATRKLDWYQLAARRV
ncbi:MAG TPA: cell envelope integrity protein CreD [Luteimonas sp.]|jgi:inner membrane protein|nr:cell envelope integrity protein CreD [Luteimonas sp.]